MKKLLLLSIVSALVFSFSSYKKETPREETGVDVTSIWYHYYTNSASTYEIAFEVSNQTAKPINWIKFDFEIYDEESLETVVEGTFECGSKTDASIMRIAPFSKSKTPAIPYAISLDYLDEDSYAWWTEPDEIEYATATGKAAAHISPIIAGHDAEDGKIRIGVARAVSKE